MLVLTRKVGEKIVIGSGPDMVTVTVKEIGHGNVRLAFEAPKEVKIVRSELLDRNPGSSSKEQ